MPSEAEVRRRRQQQGQSPAPQGGATPYPLSPDASQKIVGKAASAVGSVTPEVVKKPIKNIVNKTLDFLDRIEGAAAEVMAIPPGKGSNQEIIAAAKKGYQSGLQGVGTEEEPGYRKAFPGKFGELMNIVQPAGFALPVGTAAKTIGHVAKEAKGLAGLGVVAASARNPTIARNVKMAEDAGKMVKGAVHQKTRMKNLGIEEALPIQREYFGNKAVIDHRRKTELAKKIDELIPSVESHDRMRVALEKPAPLILKPAEEIEKINKRIFDLKTRSIKLAQQGSALEQKAKDIPASSLAMKVPEAKGAKRAKALDEIGGEIDEAAAREIELDTQIKTLRLRRSELQRQLTAGAMKQALHPKSLHNLPRGASRADIVKATQKEMTFKNVMRMTLRNLDNEIASKTSELASTKSVSRRTSKQGASAVFKDYPVGQEKTLARRQRKADRAVASIANERLRIDEKIKLLEERAQYVQKHADDVKTGKYKMQVRAHQKLLDEMTPNEREAYDLLDQWNTELEGRRTAGGTLEEEAARAFEQKHGVVHVPRVTGTRDEVISAIDWRVAELEAMPPNPDLPPDAINDEIEALMKMREEFEAMPTNPLQKLIARARGRGQREPGYLKERQIGPLKDIGALKNMYNRSVTETFGIADAQTAYAIADRTYMQGLQDFLKAKGIAVAGKDKKDGYVKVKSHFPGLDDDLWVPKNVSDELYGVSKGLRTADEEVSHIALELIGHLNGMFRNMVLFMGSPEYFSRNMIQSPLNAYLDKRVKMGIKSLPTYKEMYNIAGRYQLGFEPSKTRIIKGTGMTEEKLIDTAIREGVFHAGMSQEAYVQAFGKPKKPSLLKTTLTAPLPVDSSALVRSGKAANQLIENSNRLATFVHQLRKGESVRAAADDVLRVHFDYAHGLTSFQKNVIRPAFPLASWQMFNLPFQLEMLAQNPRAFLNQAKAINSAQALMGGPPMHRELVTGFLENPAVRVEYDEKKKEWRYLMLGSWSTTSDLDKLTDPHKFLDEIQNQFHFAPKLIHEWNTGWKIATSQQKSREIGKPGQYKQLFGRDIDQRAEYFLRIVRPLRVASETYNEYRGRGPRAAFERYFLGKTFPVNESEQIEYFKKGYKHAMSDLKKQYAEAAEKNPERMPKIIESMQQLQATYVDVLGGKQSDLEE